MELEALKPNLVSRCDQAGGKIVHRLGTLRCLPYKSWQYSDAVELQKLKLKQMMQSERENGIAQIKAETISPVAKLNLEALSPEAAARLEAIIHEEEVELEEAG